MGRIDGDISLDDFNGACVKLSEFFPIKDGM
ncbi:Uncharacterised protein [Providencia rettgeri]|nr:hypothetical protein [Providencia rettgeri]CAB5546165.1 Uncharacterised protein [Providencia rettgeri]CAC9161981.1 Uncharacterised protein [Providencia rettgeri]